MNYIARLTAERDAARATLDDARATLGELLAYLASDKFCGADADYIHVRTDSHAEATGNATSYAVRGGNMIRARWRQLCRWLDYHLGC